MYGSVINAVEPREGIVNINIGPSPVYVKGAHRIPTV
jgi:hypothetical protein